MSAPREDNKSMSAPREDSKNGWWSIPACAALWTGIERLHAYTGFAWLDLGNAAIAMPLPMRLAPITGVYGISFVFALLAAAVAAVVLQRPRRELLWVVPLVLLPALPRLPLPREAHHQALVVQPNFDTEMQWTPAVTELAEQKLALLSKVPLSKSAPADLVIWPEAPAPFYPDEPAFRNYIGHVAQDAQAYFLLGAVGYNDQREPLNSAFLLQPNGIIEGRYDKMNLVPFGEFIPPLFGWVNRITHEVGDFVPGTHVVDFQMDGHTAGVFICYESVLPDFVRRFVRDGAEVLINISNDGYFGRSAAHEQHLLIARMRAAENRRWLIRSTNDGISAVIDPRGRIVDRMPAFTQMSQLMPFDYVTEQTVYTRYGDWFAWSCLIIGLALGITGGTGFSLRRRLQSAFSARPPI
jgi:apolipoprotein N-acyltransferase